MWIVLLLLSTAVLTEDVNAFTYVKNDLQHFSENYSWSAIRTRFHSRGNCTPNAIEEFPRPFMDREQRLHGGLLLNLFIAIYALAALIIICNNYLVPSLHCICKEFKIAPDVAGATILVVGESAPELVTIIISVLVTKDDIGMSNVIGSSMYNYVFVTSACVLFTKNICQLNWWPLFRDCLYYIITLIVLIFVISNRQISWYESILLLLMYFVYVIIMYFNSTLEKMANNCLSHFGLKQKWSPTNDNIKLHEDVSVIESHKPSEFESEELKKKTSKLETCLWWIFSPLYITFKYTVPSCSSKKWEKYYLLTFVMTIIWVCIFSYIILWMIIIIGYTLSIPDSVMGLTFVAAAAATPDTIASFAIFKQGHGNMAISNAVGSNIFDILICLGLPWFIQTAIIAPGSHIKIYSSGLHYSLYLLLIYFLISTLLIVISKGKLSKIVGITFMCLYFTFIILASLIDLNIFGDLNPKECLSNY